MQKAIKIKFNSFREFKDGMDLADKLFPSEDRYRRENNRFIPSKDGVITLIAAIKEFLIDFKGEQISKYKEIILYTNDKNIPWGWDWEVPKGRNIDYIKVINCIEQLE